jgi:hypothetical protein
VKTYLYLILSFSSASQAKESIFKDEEVALAVRRLNVATKAYRSLGAESFLKSSGINFAEYEYNYWITQLSQHPPLPKIHVDKNFLLIWDDSSNTPLALLPKTQLKNGTIYANGKRIYFPNTRDTLKLHQEIKGDLMDKKQGFSRFDFTFISKAWSAEKSSLDIILTLFGGILKSTQGERNESVGDAMFYNPEEVASLRKMEAEFGTSVSSSYVPDLNVYNTQNTNPIEAMMMAADARVIRGGARALKPQGKYRKAANDPTGFCYRYVKLALKESGLVKDYLPGEKAEDAGRWLERAGFLRCKSVKDPNMAPLGSILVYGGPGDKHLHGKVQDNPGHIEIRTKNGFVSDFITKYRPSIWNARPLKAVYVKGISCPVST